jgi:hypothetical protein
MNKKIMIELSEGTHLQAEERAREKGFPTLEAYVDALIKNDASLDLDEDWIRQKFNEGLASGKAEPLTGDLIRALVAEGISRASKKA